MQALGRKQISAQVSGFSPPWRDSVQSTEQTQSEQDDRINRQILKPGLGQGFQLSRWPVKRPVRSNRKLEISAERKVS
jgi:hypothetical protein